MSTLTAPPQTIWKIDTAHTNVEFSVRHLMITSVKGRFAEVSGTVTFDETDPSNGAVEVSINVNSVDTRDAQRDAHLKSGDFFAAEKYPTMTFRSTRVENVRGDRFTLVGDLTLHGVTKEVALNVTSEGRAKDPWGGERAGFTAAGTLKRSDFGLTWNQALETGGVVVGDDIKLALDVELVRQ